MRPAEVSTEMAAAARHVLALGGRGLAELGVTEWHRLARDGLLGFASGEITRHDIFSPSPLGDGPLHLLVPCIEDDVAIDYVAFRPERPAHWGLRSGIGATLGHAALEEARRGYGWGEALETLRLHATPLDWLCAGGVGCCVVDGFGRETADQVRELRRIAVAAPKFARALRRALIPPLPPLPEIVVQWGKASAARDGER